MINTTGGTTIVQSLRVDVNSLPDTAIGMTLRDWFAGMAMQALVNGYTSNQRGFNPREFAILAYGMADEMIKEGAIK